MHFQSTESEFALIRMEENFHDVVVDSSFKLARILRCQRFGNRTGQFIKSATRHQKNTKPMNAVTVEREQSIRNITLIWIISSP